MATLDHFQSQLLGTFLAPGSTLSIAALAITGAVAILLLLINRQSSRPMRVRTAVRALFPRRLWRTPSGRADLGWFVFSLLFSGLLFGWAIIASAQIAQAVDAAIGEGAFVTLPAVPAILIATITGFLAYELAYYFDHWLMHRVPALWAFHRVHHSADHLSLLTVFRVHPVETIGFYNIVAVLVGVTQGVMPHLIGSHAAPQTIGQANIILFVGAVLVTHLQHSHFWVRFGDRWGRVLLGPAHHQIHHSNDPAHFDTNFGNLLTLFDRMFGTFHMPVAERPLLRFGADRQSATPHGLAAMTVMPFVEAGQALRGQPTPPLLEEEVARRRRDGEVGAAH